MGLWVKGIAVAFASAIVVAIPQVLGENPDFSSVGLKKMALTIIAAGLTGVGLYLKQSPIQKRTDEPTK